MGLQGISQVVLNWTGTYRRVGRHLAPIQRLDRDVCRKAVPIIGIAVLACWALLANVNLAHGQESTQIDDALPAKGAPTAMVIALDVKQETPVLALDREIPAPAGRFMKRAFELSAKGVLTNAPGTRMTRNVQLSADQVQELLTAAVAGAGLVELDAASLAAEIKAAAAGPLTNQLSKSTKSVWTIELPAGKNELPIQGFDFAKIKFPKIKVLRNLALLEAKCNYLIAKDVLGTREAKVIAAVNNEAKARKLAIRELKPEDLRSAYELKNGRFQVTFEVKHPNPDDAAANDVGAANDGPTAKVTYYEKGDGAEPMIRFFGLIQK